MSDTVFVLGAGFSSNAEMPVQEAIMKNIASSLRTTAYYKNVLELYSKLFNIRDKRLLNRIPLEDVFTFLDRSVSNREDINNLHLDEILHAQASMRKLIAMILNKNLKAFARYDKFAEKRRCYNSFFQNLINRRKAALAKDEFSIVSLNWDTIPEYFISSISRTKRLKRIRVDYTCYDYGYNTRDHIPSIYLKTSKYFNLKLMKLHGSLNWGYCSSCGRLYVKYSESSPPVFYEKKEAVCKHCSQTNLKRLMITPTLVKDLNNTHLKMIWHNALMDLQEAKRIVFVGYSFPLADFEFRYILTKAIAGSKGKRKKKIRVILYPPNDFKLKYNVSEDEWRKMKWARNLVKERYNNFFGSHNLKFKNLDAIDFMKDNRQIWDW
ncbi:MAG: hypothetical protein M1353_06015 [Nitrospirae bacterium]|nr:hypothetical protein [Nitrospirota bacterium]